MALKTFDEVVMFARTGLNPRNNFKLGNGNNKYITIKNIHNNKLVIDENTDVVDDDAIELIHKRSQIKKGDILFCSIGRMGDMFIISEEPAGWDINESVFAFTVNTDIVRQKYFYYVFKNRDTIEYLSKNSSGSTFKSIKMNQLKKMVFDLPTLSEQDQIVDVLDRLSLIIKNRENELAKLDELIKARFVELFGTLNDNENGFDVVTIEEVCSLIKDGTHQTPQYTEDREEGYKFLSSKDVMSQKIDWTDIKYIPAELHEKLYATIKPQRNDILMSKNGVNYGVAAVNDTDEVFDIYVSLALLRPKEMIDPVFFRCVINNPETKRQFDSSIKGIGVPNLHLGEIKKTKIFLPPMELQKKFVNFVKQVDKSKFGEGI